MTGDTFVMARTKKYTARKSFINFGENEKKQRQRIQATLNSVQDIHEHGRGRRRKYRPGAKALKEIRRYQKSTELLLRRLPFQVRVILESNAIRQYNCFWLSTDHCLEAFLLHHYHPVLAYRQYHGTSSYNPFL